MTASPNDGIDPAPRPHATAEQVEAARKDTKLAQVLYHDWEAETLRRQVVDLATTSAASTTPAAGSTRRARRGAARAAVRPGAGTGLRHRILPAQPDPGRRRPARLGDRPVAGHGQGGHPQRPRTSAWRSTAASPTPRASRTTTTPSTWSSGTPCCTTSPTSSCRCARSCACSSRAAGSSSPVSRPRSATSTPAALADADLGGHHHASPSCRSWPAGAARRPSSTSPRAPPRWRRSSTCTPSTRPTWRRWRQSPAPSRCRPPPRSSPPRCWAGRCARSRRRCRREAGLGLGQVRVRQLDDAELGRRQRLAPRRAARAGSTT